MPSTFFVPPSYGVKRGHDCMTGKAGAASWAMRRGGVLRKAQQQDIRSQGPRHGGYFSSELLLLGLACEKQTFPCLRYFNFCSL